MEELCHDMLNENIKQELAFDPSAELAAQRERIRQKFIELTGLDQIEKNAADDPALEIEFEEKREGYTLTRFTFASEVGTRVPCYLLIPDTGKERYPVAITLQGHSTGFHNSIGEIKFPEKDTNYQPRGAFGLQAVKNGYAALCIEQRGMGERRPTEKKRDAKMCLYTAMTALMLGRTVLGERVWDVHCAIDVLRDHFKVCNTDEILITGNSGGGTATYYCACYDERIKLAVPSCAFCTYKASILDIFHCSCNYIPNAYRYFEMQDLAMLIAPRPIAVIAGELDPIFPIHGVREGYATLEKIYRAEGAEDRCRLVVTPREHWWCEDLVWSTINEETEKLGWKR
jgi:cephalosporin-C deacetylase-like acetyl esterase